MIRSFSLFSMLLCCAAGSAIECETTVALQKGRKAIIAREVLAYREAFPLSNLTDQAYTGTDGVHLAIRDMLAQQAIAERYSTVAVSLRGKTILDQTERDVLIKCLDRKVAKEIEPSRQDISQYYESHPESTRLPEMADFEYVFLRSTTNETSETAKQILLSLLETVKSAGEIRRSLNSLPSTLSGRISSRRVNGKRGQFAREIDNQVFQTPSGQFSDVFAGKYGWYFIKVHSRQPARILSLDEVTTQIRARLLSERQSSLRAEAETRLPAKMPLTIITKSVENLTTDSAIAHVGDVPITAAQIAIKVVGSSDPTLLKGSDEAAVQRVIAEMARDIRLAEYAREQGCEADPWLRALIPHARNRALTNAVLTIESSIDTPTTDELRRFAASEKLVFKDQPMVRIKELFCEAPEPPEGPQGTTYALHREKCREIMIAKLNSAREAGAGLTLNSQDREAGLRLIEHNWAPLPNLGRAAGVAVQDLTPGQLSDLTESRIGLHIYSLLERKESRTLSFDESTTQTLAAYRAKASAAKLDVLLQQAYKAGVPSVDEGLVRALAEKNACD